MVIIKSYVPQNDTNEKYSLFCKKEAVTQLLDEKIKKLWAQNMATQKQIIYFQSVFFVCKSSKT